MQYFAIFAFIAVLGSGAQAAAVAPKESTLPADLLEFVGLLPVLDMASLALDYAQNDDEVRQAIKYMQGPEWASVVEEVANHPTWIDFKAYMLEEGVDIDKYIQIIHDIIAGLSKNEPKKSTRSMRSFVDEMKELIPEKELLALLNEKLENSADFIAMWAKLSSKDAQNFFEEMRANEHVIHMAAQMEEWGIDVDKILEVLYKLLGWN